MTVPQEVSLLTGVTGQAYVGYIPPLGSLCIPGLNLEDGPYGVADGMKGVTKFPVSVSMAATWDTAAARTYGQVTGAEQASKGTTVELGPTINMVRDPRWGRASEALGEDPYLAGAMGASQITGIQSAGVMAQVKHLAAYNVETNRQYLNAIVDRKTEQEIYLPAFGDAVRQGAAASVMCSFNSVNGTPACGSSDLLTTVLRRQFGFGGFVTSDWPSTPSTTAANAGLNMDMPGDDGKYGSNLVNAVNAGTVSKATVDALTSQVLTEMFAFGLFDKSPTGSPVATVTDASHVVTARNLAEEGTVLLKNAGGVLPLASSTPSIAVIGADASTNPVTGNQNVISSGTVTPLQGITARAGTGVKVSYDEGTDTKSAAALAASSSVAVVFAGKLEEEGKDLPDIDLSSADNSVIAAVAAANPNTIVVLNTGSAVTMPWLSQVKGVIEAWWPGQQDGNAIAATLFGDSNPSGHLPVTFPTSLSQVPANTAAQWPPVPATSTTPITVQYSEGVNVGYRWYDSQNLTPLFPFGFGLSYTTFKFSGLSISPLVKGGAATVTATVTNTGSRAGADVAQLYVTEPAAANEPPKQLQGYSRVDLQPGQSKTVSFPLTQSNLHFWDSTANNWATAPGDYTIRVGDSSRDLPLSGTLTVDPAQIGQTVTATNPGPQEGVAGVPVSVPVTAGDSTVGETLSYSATGLPAGLSIDFATGNVTGTPTTAGTNTVTVRATGASGAYDSTTFVWTVTPPGTGRPVAPIVNTSGQCIDVAGNADVNSTKVQVYTCNGTPAQQWTEQNDDTIHANGKCLDVAGGATQSGTLVQLYGCNSSPAQVWRSQADGTLVNPQSGLCLSIPGNTAPDGTQLDIEACTGASGQRWHREGAVGVMTGYQGLCMDVYYAHTTNGTPVQVYNCSNNNAAQQWTQRLDNTGTGTFQAFGKCLDVAGGRTDNGTPVQLHDCNGTGAQKWQARADGTLLNPQSGRCLTDPNNGGAWTQLQIWDCTSGPGANQKWNLS